MVEEAEALAGSVGAGGRVEGAAGGGAGGGGGGGLELLACF